MADGMTTKATLIVPQVMADMVSAKFTGKLVIADYAVKDNTLQGNVGDTITFPSFNALGEMTDLVVGTPMTPEQMGTDSFTATIKEVGKAVEIHDTALLSVLGNPVEEATSQFAVLYARKVDADLYAEAVDAVPSERKILKADTSSFSAKVAKAKAMWGDESENIAVVLIHSGLYSALIQDSNFIDNTKYQADVLLKGEIGRIYGVPVVMTDRVGMNVKDSTSLVLERNALGLLTKRNPMIEKDRDILNRSTVVTINAHYAVKLMNPKGIAVIEHTIA